MAQEPIDTELVSLQRQALLEAEKEKIAKSKEAQALAKKNTLLNSLPSTDTLGLDGEIKNEDGSGFYSNILVYDSIDDIAKELAAIYSSQFEGKNKVFIITEADLKKEKDLWVFLCLKLKFINDELKKSVATYGENFIEALDGLDQQQNNIAMNRNKAFGFYSSTVQVEENLTLADSYDFIIQSMDSYKVLQNTDGGVESVKSLSPLISLPLVLGALSDITSFFKTDYILKNVDTSVDLLALQSIVARELKSEYESVDVLLPEGSFKSDGKLANLLTNIVTNRGQLSKVNEIMKAVLAKDNLELEDKISLLNIEIAIETEIIKKLISAISKDSDIKTMIEDHLSTKKSLLSALSDTQALKKDNNLVVNHIQKLIDAADDVISFVSTENSNGLSPLDQVSVIDQIKQAGNESIILYLNAVLSGGEAETSKSVFSQGKISYIGGTIINYIFYSSNGKILDLGVYRKIKSKVFKRRKGIVFDN